MHLLLLYSIAQSVYAFKLQEHIALMLAIVTESPIFTIILRRVCTWDILWFCILCMLAESPPLAATLAYIYTTLP